MAKESVALIRFGISEEGGLNQDKIKMPFIMNCCHLVFQYKDQKLL